MKKRVVLTGVLVIILVSCAGSASANIFRDFWGGITGMVTGEPVSEQVECRFADSSKEQICFTEDGKFKCSGTPSCTVAVSGGEGAKLNWKSTCGGYASNVLDGTNDVIEFKCQTATTTTTVQITTNTLNEKVKCIFSGSDTAQTCYTDNGQYKCSGTGSCTADVSGAETKLNWKSSCGGYASTIIDGVDDSIGFRCETTTTTTTIMPVSYAKEQVKCIFSGSDTAQTCYTDNGQFKCSGTASCSVAVSGGEGTKLNWKSTCGGYASNIIDGVDDSIEFVCTTTTTIVPVSYAKEQVKCVFTNSANSETCFTWDGKFKCSGVGSCVADVSGFQGYKVEWKSSCGNKEQYTVFDGTGETIMFVCPTLNTATTIPTPGVKVEATILPVAEMPAVIERPLDYAHCSAGCTCLSKAKAEGEGFVPCGGSLQQCEQGDMFCYTPGTTTTTLAGGNVILHFFYWNDNCPLCNSEKQFLELMKQKYPQMQYKTYDANPPSGSQYSLIVTVFLNEGLPTLFFDNKVWETYSAAISQEIEDKIKYCLANSCSSDPSFDPQIAYARIEQRYNITDVASRVSSPLKPSVAVMPSQHNATTTEGPLTEQVQCVFLGSDVLINPNTAKKEQCYSDKFGCTWDGMFASEPSIPEKYAFCYAEVTGERGENIVWKSSCGGYSTTVIDGNTDKAVFQCVPSTNVTQAQITGKGFNKAYWQCYDGEEETNSAQCLSSETWQEHASKFCSGHCKTYDDLGITKCGVNSFGVSEECYTEQAQQVTAVQLPNILAPIQTTQQTTQAGGASSQTTVVATTELTEKKFALSQDSQAMLLYFYFNGCPHCAGMDLDVDKAAATLGIKSQKIDTNSQGDLAESYKVATVPTIILLKYEPTGIKEYRRSGKADAAAIIEWIKGSTSGGGASEKSIEAPKEEMLICKDSCPSEGKCYPFGYRKGGDFCSDSGAFTAQFGDNAKCDNNFECKTNLCVDGECIGQGIWQKFMGWFKKLFG